MRGFQRQRMHARASAAGWVVALALLSGTRIASAAETPFDVIRHEIPGRVLQVWTLPPSAACATPADELLVISIEGGPPDEIRHVTHLPCGAARDPEAAAIRRIPIEPQIVAVDFGELDAVPGLDLLEIHAGGLRIRPMEPGGEERVREIPIEGGLPLPPRDRRLTRLPALGHWHGDDRLLALLPTMQGGLLVDLGTGATRPLPLPMIADYRTFDPDLPLRTRKLMIGEFQWPVLTLADDDGDGRDDLFALSRWAIWIYRTGKEGLPEKPTRKIRLQPFTAQDEMRREATDETYFAADLDGNGGADLLLHTIAGGMMNGHSTTRLFRNPGTGAEADREADLTRTFEGGFAGIELVDLDGDGRPELFQSALPFGLLQVTRILLTGRVEIKMQILTTRPDAPEFFVPSFSDDLSFAVNFSKSSIEGLVPNVHGDFNDDGLRDLVYPESLDEIGIRLGRREEHGPGYGGRVARQPVPMRGGAMRVADLDGDGLDDIASFDMSTEDQGLVLLFNRGTLPGTPPRMKAAPSGR